MAWFCRSIEFRIGWGVSSRWRYFESAGDSDRGGAGVWRLGVAVVAERTSEGGDALGFQNTAEHSRLTLKKSHLGNKGSSFMDSRCGCVFFFFYSNDYINRSFVGVFFLS